MPRALGWELPHLRAWRRYRALGVTELAVKSGIPLSRLSRIENGKSRAGTLTLDRLCAALDVTREQLIHQSPPN